MWGSLFYHLDDVIYKSFLTKEPDLDFTEHPVAHLYVSLFVLAHLPCSFFTETPAPVKFNLSIECHVENNDLLATSSTLLLLMNLG